MQYFAYGSNMHVPQMSLRCPEAQPGQVGELEGWRFLINQRGVATVCPDPTATVFGVLWKVGPGDVMTLDRYEGVNEGRYERRVVHVTPVGHDPEPVIVYVDPRTQPGPPRDGYIEKVVQGAHTFGLPADYLGQLRSFSL
jgi:cation transport regulator ChaC